MGGPCLLWPPGCFSKRAETRKTKLYTCTPASVLDSCAVKESNRIRKVPDVQKIARARMPRDSRNCPSQDTMRFRKLPFSTPAVCPNPVLTVHVQFRESVLSEYALSSCPRSAVCRESTFSSQFHLGGLFLEYRFSRRDS